jgi:hypothetical protein
LFGQMPAQAVTGGVQCIGIDHRHQFGQCCFAGQGQRFGDEGGAALALRLQQLACGIDEAGRPDRFPAGGDGCGGIQDQLRCQRWSGFPGVERVGFVRQQHGELFRRVIEIEVNRCREVAQQRRDGFGVDVLEDEGLRCCAQLQQAFAVWQQAAIFGEQRDAERYQVRPGFAKFITGARVGLRAGQRVGFRFCVKKAVDRNTRRARLLVPAHELREVETRSGSHRRDEILAGHGLAVVAAEIFVHAGAETVAADQRLDHADDFGALFVHGRRVEIVDFDKALGPDRMRHRAGILRELASAQAAHFTDAGGLAVVQVGAEFLVAENRQTFLQRQLEPVAAGDAVAGPVVEIFVRDDAVDVLEIDVGGDIAARQHVLGVEDVEALVLHRAHVEIADGDDHVMVEVAFEAEAFFVPAHRFLQRRHRVRALVELARLDVDGELHGATGGGGKVSNRPSSLPATSANR